MTMKPYGKPYGIDGQRLREVGDREAERFQAMIPKSLELGKRAARTQPNAVPMAWMLGLHEHPPMYIDYGDGAYFFDVDGNKYLDMNQADYAASLGFAPKAITDTLAARSAKGSSFLLPTEDGIVATELLAERSGLPFWQFTGSASASNMEIIRLARVATGKEILVMFEGKYHGHIDDTLLASENGKIVAEGVGLSKSALEKARIVPFNNLDALEQALAPGDVACVMAEPMLTNANIVFPDDGFWAEVRRMTREKGVLLSIDEAHTGAFAYGGLTRKWSIDPDLQTIGKGMGTGFPFSAYGMTEELARLSEQRLDRDREGYAGLMVGGTTYASALSLAVVRATLEECLTEAVYEQNALLGKRLGEGLEVIFRDRGLDWRAPWIGGRSGWILSAELPRTAFEAGFSLDPDFTRAKRLYLLTHGVWESLNSAGPVASFSHTAGDVDEYLKISAAFLDEVMA